MFSAYSAPITGSIKADRPPPAPPPQLHSPREITNQVGCVLLPQYIVSLLGYFIHPLPSKTTKFCQLSGLTKGECTGTAPVVHFHVCCHTPRRNLRPRTAWLLYTDDSCTRLASPSS